MNSPLKLEVKVIQELNVMELEDLCDATMATMQETNGFTIGTQPINPYEKAKIMSYWEGVLLVPERILIVGTFEGTIAGSVQVIVPSPSNKTSSFACSLDNYFVAPWARGKGLSELLLEYAEAEAKSRNMIIVKLSVRQNRYAAIKVFEKRHYIKWGELAKYELDQGKIVGGNYYYKEL